MIKNIFLCLIICSSCIKKTDKVVKDLDSCNITQLNKKSNPIDTSKICGIWKENNGENAAFRIEGDSIYTTESIRPNYFRIDNDTLKNFYKNGYIAKYIILKLDTDSLVLLTEAHTKLKCLRIK